MTFAQLLFHLANFVLPALAMAVFMPLAGRWVMGAPGQRGRDGCCATQQLVWRCWCSD